MNLRRSTLERIISVSGIGHASKKTVAACALSMLC
jgi:hypothetical protein